MSQRPPETNRMCAALLTLAVLLAVGCGQAGRSWRERFNRSGPNEPAPDRATRGIPAEGPTARSPGRSELPERPAADGSPPRAAAPTRPGRHETAPPDMPEGPTPLVGPARPAGPEASEDVRTLRNQLLILQRENADYRARDKLLIDEINQLKFRNSQLRIRLAAAEKDAQAYHAQVRKLRAELDAARAETTENPDAN